MAGIVLGNTGIAAGFACRTTMLAAAAGSGIGTGRTGARRGTDAIVVVAICLAIVVVVDSIGTFFVPTFAVHRVDLRIAIVVLVVATDLPNASRKEKKKQQIPAHQILGFQGENPSNPQTLPQTKPYAPSDTPPPSILEPDSVTFQPFLVTP